MGSPVNTGMSPLVAQLVQIMGEGFDRQKLLAQQKRQNDTEDLFNALKLAGVQRQQAAQTPIADAPVQSIEDAAGAAGVAPMNHDVASFATDLTPRPIQRNIVLKTPQGKVIPFGPTMAPVQYKEEADAEKLDDIEKNKIASGLEMMVTPEISKALPVSLQGIYPAGKSIPTTILQRALTPEAQWENTSRDLPDGTKQGGRLNRFTGEKIWDPIGTTSSSDVGADVHGEEYLKTLPDPADREMAVAWSEGRVPLTVGNRPGSPGFKAMKNGLRYDPTADMQTVKERQQFLNDLAKTSTNSRGGVISALNQGARHIARMQEASDALDKAGWSTHDYQSANRAEMMASPAGSQAAVTRYEQDASAVSDEVIKAISGGTPTDQVRGEKAWETLKNPASPKPIRDAALETLRSLIQDRAQSQEDAFTTIFGKPSVQSKKGALFAPGSGWTWTPESGWQIPLTAAGIKLGSTSTASPGATAATKPAATLPVVKTQEDFDALPSGAFFMTEDGHRKRKP